MGKRTGKVLTHQGEKIKNEFDKHTIINPEMAVNLVGKIAKQLKERKIVPEYVILCGTEAFVITIPVDTIFEKILRKKPRLLTPILPRTSPIITFKREINRQLKITKADKTGTYLILDVSMMGGGTLIKAKVALDKMTKGKATIYTGVLACKKKIKEKVEKSGKNPVYDLKELEIDKLKVENLGEDDKYGYYMDAYLPDFVGEFTRYISKSSWIKNNWIGVRRKRYGKEYQYELVLEVLPKKHLKRIKIMRQLTNEWLKKEGYKKFIKKHLAKTDKIAYKKGRKEFTEVMSAEEAVELLGKIVEQLKNKKIKPDYVVLVGTAAFIFNTPIAMMMRAMMECDPILLTPIISSVLDNFERNKNEIELQLKASKARKNATYLIFDGAACSGGTLYATKVTLRMLIGKKAKIHTAVLICSEEIPEKIKENGENPVFYEDDEETTELYKGRPKEEKEIALADLYLPDFVGSDDYCIPGELWGKEPWMGVLKSEKSSIHAKPDEKLFKFKIFPKLRKNRNKVIIKITKKYLEKEGYEGPYFY